MIAFFLQDPLGERAFEFDRSLGQRQRRDFEVADSDRLAECHAMSFRDRDRSTESSRSIRADSGIARRTHRGVVGQAWRLLHFPPREQDPNQADRDRAGIARQQDHEERCSGC